MKTILLIGGLVLGSVLVYSQQASKFLDSTLHFQTSYEVTPLDSLNDPIISEMFYRRDLFLGLAEYEGKLANIVNTKNAPTEDSLLNVDYHDSLFLHFDGTDGYEYFQIGPLEDFLRSLDSMGIDPNFGFLDFFKSLQEWYSLYRFSATINDEYNLLSIDTLVAGFNARFEYLGERFDDETINTVLGSFDCKKFLISWKISVNIGIWLPIITTNDTVWIIPGNEFWMVQDIIPTNHINLSLLGIPPFSIPGLKTVIIDTAWIKITDVEDEQIIPTEIFLKQNYPNPFNPSTKIEFSIQDFGLVSLKIYDILGNEIITLVNSEKPVGVYEIEWNASGLPSGVYFYQLKTEGFVETKKMILLK